MCKFEINVIEREYIFIWSIFISVIHDRQSEEANYERFWFFDPLLSVSLSGRVFFADHFAQKMFIFHQELPVLESKYWYAFEVYRPLYQDVRGILTRAPVVLDEKWKFFEQNDQRRKLYKTG